MKYPRTPHLYWSKNRDDDDKSFDETQSLAFIANPGLLIEEKLDGANACIHFEENRLVLRSRGDEIRGGSHPQWDMFKSWASAIELKLRDRIGSQFAVYGEWLYAEHNIHYRELPHYFMEFDVLDKTTGVFLDTKSRWDLLAPAGIVSVPVLHRGKATLKELQKMLLRESMYGAERRANRLPGTPYQPSLIEGLYFKLEQDGQTIGRAKWVSPEFTRQVLESEHWSKMTVTPNLLTDGVDMWT